MTAPPSATRKHTNPNIDTLDPTVLLEQSGQRSEEFEIHPVRDPGGGQRCGRGHRRGGRFQARRCRNGDRRRTRLGDLRRRRRDFGHSILFTRKQVKRAVLQVRRTGTGTATVPASPDDDRTVVIPRAVIPAVNAADLTMVGSRPGPERTEPGRPRPTRRRVGTGLVLAVTAATAVFASSLGAVTLIEAVKGSPLAGGDSGGLSVLGGNGGTSVQETTDTGTPSADPTTVIQTVTSEVVTTATTTEPAPSSSAATPSAAEQASTPTPTSRTTEPAPTTPSPSDAAGTGSAGVLSGSAGSGSDSPVTAHQPASDNHRRRKDHHPVGSTRRRDTPRCDTG